MMSLESVFPEEWRLSNVLSSTDLYWDELHRNHISHDGGGGGSELWKADLCNQLGEPNDSGIGIDLDSFSIPWLDEETCITNLDASLQISSLPDVDDPVAEVLADLESMEADSVETGVGSFETPAEFLVPDKITTPVGSFGEKSNYLSVRYDSPAPSSPIELSSLDHVTSMIRSTPVVKYVEPSSIDTTGLTSGAQIVMNDLNVLHLPEPHDDQAGLMLIEALTDPSLAVELPLEEVESMLSSPPSSPEATVPTSSYQDADDDDEYVPTANRKRKATSAVSARSLKSLKPSEKKERKKVQNKNAATKYRIKKRQEDDQVKVELEQLESRNVNLRRQVEDLSSEITYMKGLLNEVLKGKGLKIK